MARKRMLFVPMARAAASFATDARSRSWCDERG